MKLSYKLTEDDFIEFNLFHYKQLDSYKKNRLLLGVLIPLLLSAFMIFIGYYVFKQNIFFWIAIAVGFFLFNSISFPKKMDNLFRKEVINNLKTGDNTQLFARKDVFIDNLQIAINSNGSQEIISLDSIIKGYETNSLYVLYNSSITAHLFPKRDLNKDQRAYFESLLEKLSL